MIFTRCSLCEGFFHKPIRTRSKPGRTIYSRSSCCIYCQREKRRNYYHSIPKESRVYKTKLEHNKKWHDNNKKSFRQYQTKWEILNRDKIKERKREYYLKNKDKILRNNALWKMKNRKAKNTSNSGHIWRRMEQGRVECLKTNKEKRIFL